MLHGKRVMVTGAGGSIGRIGAQILTIRPKVCFVLIKEIAIFNLQQNVLK